MKRFIKENAPFDRSRRFAIAILLLPAVTVSCGRKSGAEVSSASASPSRSGVLRIGFPSPTGTAPSGPEGWAYQKGRLIPALKSQGITEAKFIALPNGPEIDEALTARAIDLGIFGDAPAILGRGAGVPGRAINIGSVGGNCYLVARKDGPKTVEELKGKTVGAAKGSNMARYLIGLLAEKGLSGQVKIVHLLQGDAEAALLHGDIAAYPSGSGPLMARHGFKIIDQAINHRNLTGASVTVATNDFLAEHPGFPAAWNQARIGWIRDLKKERGEYFQTLAERARIPADLYEKLYPSTLYAVDPFTPEGIAALEGTQRFLKSQRLLKSDFRIQDWILKSGQATKIASNDSTVNGERRP